MGRPPKPTKLKVVENNPGRRPLNTSEPKARGRINKPKDLSKKASALWGRMVKWLGKDHMDLLNACDELALAMLAENYAEWWECVKQLRKEGRVIEVPNSMGDLVPKSNPLAAQEADLQRRLFVLISRFGFTPSDRVKLGSSDGDQGEFEDMIAQFTKPRKNVA